MFKRKSVILITLGLLTITLLLGSALNHSPTLRKITEQTSPPLSQGASTEQSSTPNHPGEQPGSLKSGPEISLPWEEDRAFLEAQTRASAPVLLAAYRTVLLDPLPGEEENVHLAARYLAGMVISSGEVFSQNNSIGPYSESRGFKSGPTYLGNQMTTTTGGGVCKIASTLYNVAVLSNLPVVERHAHSMPVPYVPYGQDATVSFGTKDLKMRNDRNFPILIWAQGVDNVLYIGFYGKEKAPRVEWQHKYEKSYKSYTIYHLNPKYSQGEEKVAMEGMDGGIIRSWAKIFQEDGTWNLKDLGLSYYSPLPRIVEKGNSATASSERF